MADGNQRFQRSFRHCVLFGVAWTLVISALFAGARLLAGKTVQALPVSPVLAVLGVLAFFTLLAVAISWYYGLEANSTILRVRSWSGSYVDIPWPAIEAVDSLSLAGFPVLRVRYSGAPRPAFMPLWLSDPSAFRAAATTYAGDRNALVRWLAEHPRAGRFRFV